ncbi:hypothetical protein E4U42_007028 [Claviceps africana]|uniref:Uncharacterized protein n=1 Tax=Claviceps africana TaxID=83212 RepID=A0A8K0JGZ6_9HYPO|nr:hypothetical protein E4U42_007028 [Claviceps africana]
MVEDGGGRWRMVEQVKQVEQVEPGSALALALTLALDRSRCGPGTGLALECSEVDSTWHDDQAQTTRPGITKACGAVDARGGPAASGQLPAPTAGLAQLQAGATTRHGRSWVMVWRPPTRVNIDMGPRGGFHVSLAHANSTNPDASHVLTCSRVRPLRESTSRSQDTSGNSNSNHGQTRRLLFFFPASSTRLLMGIVSHRVPPQHRRIASTSRTSTTSTTSGVDANVEPAERHTMLATRSSSAVAAVTVAAAVTVDEWLFPARTMRHLLTELPWFFRRLLFIYILEEGLITSGGTSETFQDLHAPFTISETPTVLAPFRYTIRTRHTSDYMVAGRDEDGN